MSSIRVDAWAGRRVEIERHVVCAMQGQFPVIARGAAGEVAAVFRVGAGHYGLSGTLATALSLDTASAGEVVWKGGLAAVVVVMLSESLARSRGTVGGQPRSSTAPANAMRAGATLVREEVFVAEAASDDQWRWRSGEVSVDSAELARRSVDALRRRVAGAAP